MKRLLVLLLFGSVATAMHLPYVHEYAAKQKSDELGKRIVELMHAARLQMIANQLIQFPVDIFNQIISLVNEGANLNVIAYGTTPLIDAIETNQLLLAKHFLKHGVDINRKDPVFGANALITYLKGRYRNIELVKFLIENGIDINAQDNSGRTALMYAAENGFDDIVKLLIDGVKSKTHQLLQLERQETYLSLLPADVIKSIDEYITVSADPNILSKEGKTALDYAREAVAKTTSMQVDSEEKLSKKIYLLNDYTDIILLLKPITNRAQVQLVVEQPQQQLQPQSQPSRWKFWRR